MRRVVVVDTGIDLHNNKLICKHKCTDGYFIRKDKEGTIQVTNIAEDAFCIQDEIGHGTGIAEIIATHNKNIELTIIKIFSTEFQSADEDLLCYVLDFVLNNLQFDLLNLSLGVSYIKEPGKLEGICEEYRIRNKIIISAFDNGGAISFPAAFKNVIGVTNGENCYKSNEYYVTDNKCVNICAKGRAQRVYWKEGKQIIAHGNSYACAHFSGIVSGLASITTWDDLCKHMDEIACPSLETETISTSNMYQNSIAQYKNAVVFPFNKEIHSLVRFSSKLPFNLVDVYDVKYSARVGAHTNTLLQEQCEKDYVIKDIRNIDLDSFDSFILGHTDELLCLANLREIKTELISKLLASKKMIYSFDDIRECYNDNSDARKLVYSPAVYLEDRYIAPFGKLYRQDKPVLGIFGTSSSQGKMTLQLKIRYELIKRGYKLCQLGTEPSSLLYGMDCVFPIGYNSSVMINQYDTVAFLNKQLYCMSRDSDLIIVGGQSGLVLREEGNLSNYLFQQIDYLYATLPDNVILCINSFDDFEVIDRAIRFIESAISCKVIALSIYPFYCEGDYISDQYLKVMSQGLFNKRFKPKLESAFNLPVYFPNSEFQIEELCDLIIESFCSDT